MKKAGRDNLMTLRRAGAADIIGALDFSKEELIERKKMAEVVGLAPLVTLLEHDHIKVRGLAERVLAALFEDDEGEIVVADKGLIPVSEMFKFKNFSAQHDGLWTLAILAGLSDKNHEEIINDIGWQMILARAKNAKQEGIRLAGLTLIANLGSNEAMHDMILNEGGIELLKNIAAATISEAAPDLRFQKAVCSAFANLSYNDANASSILSSGGLEFLQVCLTAEDQELVAAAAQALANTAMSEDCVDTLKEAQVGEAMIPLLKSDDDKIVKAACQGLAILLEDEEYQKALIAAGLIDPLLRLARNFEKHSEDVQREVATCLANLCSTEHGKEAVLKAGGLALMQRMLDGAEDEETKLSLKDALAYCSAASREAKKRAREQAERERMVREQAERERAAAEQAERERARAAEEERKRKEAEDRARREAEERARAEQAKKKGVDLDKLRREAEEAKRRAQLEKEARARLKGTNSGSLHEERFDVRGGTKGSAPLDQFEREAAAALSLQEEEERKRASLRN